MRASTMQLERREAIELVLSSRALSLSEVATRLSSFEVKTTELEKSYKRSGVLNLKHREVRCCDEKKYRSYKFLYDLLDLCRIIQVRSLWALRFPSEI